ncbi:hypothetical protein HDU97_000459 [Phlyctochytrium planicorne]|nr:hypothetical protein HDU97_000459 [Phlyctochytrium planicorne]
MTELATELLRIASMQLAYIAGFDRTNLAAANLLSDVMMRYLENIGVKCSHAANHQQRSKVHYEDLLRAFASSGVDLESLKDYGLALMDAENAASTSQDIASGHRTHFPRSTPKTIPACPTYIPASLGSESSSRDLIRASDGYDEMDTEELHNVEEKASKKRDYLGNPKSRFSRPKSSDVDSTQLLFDQFRNGVKTASIKHPTRKLPRCQGPVDSSLSKSSPWLSRLYLEERADSDGFHKDTLYGVSKTKTPTEGLFGKALRQINFYRIAPVEKPGAVQNPKAAEQKQSGSSGNSSKSGNDGSREDISKSQGKTGKENSSETVPAASAVPTGKTPTGEVPISAPPPKLKLKLTLRPGTPIKNSASEEKPATPALEPISLQKPEDNGIAKDDNRPINVGDEISCICDHPDIDDGKIMIACDTCGFWFHGACVGITDDAPSEWFCVRCKDYQ